MRVEIWSDVACPFCYIGKTHFDNALDKFENKDEIEVVWKSFLLDPSLPYETEEDLYTSLSKRKQISAAQVDKMTKHVKSMAENTGIRMDFKRVRPVNTTKAHLLLQLAKMVGKGSEMKERLLKAYFTEGANLANRNELVDFAGDVGIAPKQVDEALLNGRYREALDLDLKEARSFQITGVPFFMLDRKYGISGAQPSEVFSKNLEIAYREWKAENVATQTND